MRAKLIKEILNESNQVAKTKEKYKIFESIPENNVGGTKINGEHFSFDVQKLYDFVKLKQYKPVEINIIKLETEEKVEFTIKDSSTGKWVNSNDLPKEKQKEIEAEEHKHIMSTELKYPIIVILDKKGKYNIIDGNHRLKKAKILGKEKIKSYIIPQDDILSAVKNKELKKLKY